LRLPPFRVWSGFPWLISVVFSGFMSSSLPGIEAIAFDLDNTLYDRDAAMNAWLRSVFPDDPDLAEEAIRRDDSGFIPRRDLYVWLSARLPWAKTWREVEVRYQAEVLRWIADDPAITTAVGELMGRYKLAILTNGGGEFQRLKLARLEVAPCFDPGRIFVSGEIGHDKPDERAFRPMMAALGVDPERILFVGDNPVNDIEGAARLGMRTCWVRLASHHQCRVAPDFTVRSAAELPRLLHPED
jgi:putative hydrolase of the HAD superfamily